MDAVCHTQMTDWLDFNGFDVTGDADTGSLMTFETDGRRVWYTLSSAFKCPKLQVCFKKKKNGICLGGSEGEGLALDSDFWCHSKGL